MSGSPSKRVPSFSAVSYQKIQADLTKRCIDKDKYIEQLEHLIQEHGIELPPHDHSVINNTILGAVALRVLQDGNIEEIHQVLENAKKLSRSLDIEIEFHNLTFRTIVSERRINTVASMLQNLLCFWRGSEKKEIDILADATSRILPRKMTLLIGPPGSGKSVLLKAISGRLRPGGQAKLSGEVYFDGDNIHSDKFLVNKVAAYVEQGDTHEAVLTVEETLKFAWMASSGGHASYGRAKDARAAEILEQDNETLTILRNVLLALGLNGCKDTYVGNASIRGVSGGQKRRVTIGEMAVCSRPVRMMDCISNGLDTATTLDIVRALSAINKIIGDTMVIALLQPPPDVYRLFDEVILLCEGHIIFHGAREQASAYFQSLGYTCPKQVDEADFLQELPTPEGKRFITGAGVVHDARTLSKAWKASALYQQILAEMKYPTLADAQALEASNPKEWYPDNKEKYATDFWFFFKICLERQWKVVTRDSMFAKARIGQSLLVGAIAGSLFSNIRVEDVTTMNGFLFNTILFGALGSFAILPIVYAQKAVFYKQKDALFYPTAAFTSAQSIAFFPLQLLETILYVLIVYWSAGLSADFNGSRFLTFILIALIFSMTVSQMFRLIAACVEDLRGAIPISGVVIVVMVLFSGFIQPKSVISDGWVWFYWINPVAWALKAVTISEFMSPKYDFLTCLDPTCTASQRFGDFVLEQYGNSTDEGYIWYSFAVLVAQYVFLFLLTTLAMEYIHTEPAPPPPKRASVDAEVPAVDTPSRAVIPNQASEMDIEAVHTADSLAIANAPKDSSLPFDKISFAFKDIWYSVTLPSGDEVDLLKGVNGFFEPGTVTALMGSSGAGKTTLLDVLAGRKNTGVIKGQMYHNGIPKVDNYFRKIMGYVEQFDTLPQKSTSREAIAFSAALRLSPNITVEQREAWVTIVLNMMDLQPLEHELIGVMDAGGMSFEQRKRVSIAVELAANPSILFLDEPTTGLDSRAAQSLIGNIRKIAASGRSIVCTIHQPSTAIFDAFDSLLLLQRGGQTVFFGQLGEHSQLLVEYFESASHVAAMPRHMNPATWMLDVIGAGTGGHSNAIDFHSYYKDSTLCSVNMIQLDALCVPNEGSRRLTDEDILDQDGYNASYAMQFRLLFHRIALTYWRTPSYSLMRHVTNIIIALIFASAYPLQTYTNYVETVSRAAVIYITGLFCGVLAMMMIIPVISAERPVFYHEQQSRMYSVFVYAAAQFLIEIPYLMAASLAFTLPFFFIVGFDNVGNTTVKFFWYWLFNFMLQGTMIFLGQFYVALAPNEPTTMVLAGLTNTVLGLFCGFLISEQNFPTFWLFMYWLDPLHYALEGLIMTQFHGDTTEITEMDGSVTIAEEYMTGTVFTTWRYQHAGFDVLALGLFMACSMVGTYLCLAFLRHDKR